MQSPSARIIDQSPARKLDIILRSSLSLVETYGAGIRESTTLNDLKRAFQSTIAELQRIEDRERQRSVSTSQFN
jgi:hypothetical protein